MQTLLTVMVITLVVLALTIIAFLAVLIYVLLMARRTLKQVQLAVAHVENTAIRSLIPLLSFRRMFSDMSGFVDSIKAWAKVVPKKKKSRSDAE